MHGGKTNPVLYLSHPGNVTWQRKLIQKQCDNIQRNIDFIKKNFDIKPGLFNQYSGYISRNIDNIKNGLNDKMDGLLEHNETYIAQTLHHIKNNHNDLVLKNYENQNIRDLDN